MPNDRFNNIINRFSTKLSYRVIGFIFILGIIAVIQYTGIISNNNNKDNINNNKTPDNWLIYTKSCKLPKIDKFDSEILEIYQNLSQQYIRCDFYNPLLRDIKRVNYSYISLPKNHTCSITEVKLAADNEATLFGKKIENVTGVINAKNFECVYVQCGEELGKHLLLVPEKPSRQGYFASTRTVKKISKPNILLFGIDSLSRLNYERHFTKTQEFLKDKNIVQFKGHHKIGDNSMPNLFAMLVGDHHYEWQNLFNKDKKLDSLPILYKNFNLANYKTFHIEDLTLYGTFTTYGLKGFIDIPIHYYPRAYTISIEKEISNEFCYKNQEETEVNL